MSDCESIAAKGAESCADEIEITPEMIDAGAAEVEVYNPDFCSASDKAEAVYLAMEIARRSIRY